MLRCLVAFVVCLSGVGLLSAQPPIAPAEEVAEPALTPAEQAFKHAMSNASLVGSFTMSDALDAPPRAERYDLGEVEKVGEGNWRIMARIRYGGHDVTLPITLPVDFAGDTAVIRVDNVGFPGLGFYSARVLIHDNKYAGYWSGGDHGGHLFGVLKRGEAAAAAKAAPPTDSPDQVEAPTDPQ